MQITVAYTQAFDISVFRIRPVHCSMRRFEQRPRILNKDFEQDVIKDVNRRNQRDPGFQRVT